MNPLRPSHSPENPLLMPPACAARGCQDPVAVRATVDVPGRDFKAVPPTSPRVRFEVDLGLCLVHGGMLVSAPGEVPCLRLKGVELGA